MDTSDDHTWTHRAARFVRNIPDHAAAFHDIEVRPWRARGARLLRRMRRRSRRATIAVGDHVSPWLIRVSAFVRKDIVEIVRQPQLLLGVVLGPFLLLLVFLFFVTITLPYEWKKGVLKWV